ncbi:MAG: helix-turn-helix transcriptional regulator [Crocosphaera sp.]
MPNQSPSFQQFKNEGVKDSIMDFTSDTLKNALNTIIDNISYGNFKDCPDQEAFGEKFRLTVIKKLNDSNYAEVNYKFWLKSLKEVTKGNIQISEIEPIAKQTASEAYDSLIAFIQNLNIPESAFKAWEAEKNGIPIIPKNRKNIRFETNNSHVPTASDPTSRTTLRGVISGINSWSQDEFGIAEYYEEYRVRTNFKDPIEIFQECLAENYVRLNIAEVDKKSDQITIKLWEEAEEILNRLGPEAALLHIYLTACCLRNPSPWKDTFILDGDTVLKDLGWDRRKRLSHHEKLLKLKKMAFALGSIYQRINWQTVRKHKGKIIPVNLSCEGFAWKVDFFTETQIRIFPEDTEEILRLAIQIEPGVWAEKFLNQEGYLNGKALNEYGYMSALITKIDPYHDDLAFRIALFLTIENRINTDCDYYVKTLLKLKYSEPILNQCDKVKAKTIRTNWDSALARLNQLGYKIIPFENYPNWLRPEWLRDENYQPEHNRRRHILSKLLEAKIIIKQPDPIPLKLGTITQKKLEYTSPIKTPPPTNKTPDKKPSSRKSGIITPADIREARQKKGWTQRQLAEFLGVSHTLVGRMEKGERTVTPKVKTKLQRLLKLETE